MTNEELAQIRAIVREETTAAVAPLSEKLDRVIDRADDILAGQVRLRTGVENRDIGVREEIRDLRERVEALEHDRQR
jgi:histidinol dehydrogenase